MLTHTSIPLAALPPALAGMSLLLVSDLHVAGERTPALHRLEPLAGLRPDLVVAAGDIVEVADLLPHVIRRLHALRPRYGVYAVWGNHDLMRYSGGRGPRWLGSIAQPVAAMRDVWAREGVKLLDNSSTRLSLNGVTLQLVGLGDATRGNDDPTRAFAAADPAEFTIVIAHNPDSAFELGAQRADLVVSGHTHGGQIVPPFMRALHTSTRHRLPSADGLMHIAGRPVFVTRGLGTVGLPFRLNAPPEASLLRLVRPHRDSRPTPP